MRAGDITGMPRLRPWQPWAALAGFAFLLHFVWEMLQVPVYAGMIEAAHGSAVRMCTIATAGDAVITLFAYGVMAVATRSRDWLGHITVGRLAGLVAVGIGMSLVAELLSIHVWQRWQYVAGVPLLAGMGLNVWLQWLLLPPPTLWLARRHLGLAGSRSPDGPVCRNPGEPPAETGGIQGMPARQH